MAMNRVPSPVPVTRSCSLGGALVLLLPGNGGTLDSSGIGV